MMTNGIRRRDFITGTLVGSLCFGVVVFSRTTAADDVGRPPSPRAGGAASAAGAGRPGTVNPFGGDDPGWVVQPNAPGSPGAASLNRPAPANRFGGDDPGWVTQHSSPRGVTVGGEVLEVNPNVRNQR